MGNGQNKQLVEGWALVAGDFCMQQGLWPSLSSFYIILPSTSTFKKRQYEKQLTSPNPPGDELIIEVSGARGHQAIWTYQRSS